MKEFSCSAWSTCVMGDVERGEAVQAMMHSPNITARGIEVFNLLPTLQVGDIRTQCQLPLHLLDMGKGA